MSFKTSFLLYLIGSSQMVLFSCCFIAQLIENNSSRLVQLPKREKFRLQTQHLQLQ